LGELKYGVVKLKVMSQKKLFDCKNDVKSSDVGSRVKSVNKNDPKERSGEFDLESYIEFQDRLQYGDCVLAKWTNSGRFYQTEARVVKVNLRSLRVELLKDYEGYTKGWVITLAKYPANKWSRNNGVFPLPSGSQGKKALDYAQDDPFTMEKGFHTRRQIPIWILRPKVRLTRQQFTELKQEVKELGGYWSRYSRGFVFEAEPDAEILDEFGKTVLTFTERDAELMRSAEIDSRPISEATNAMFNLARWHTYDLNDQYEGIVQELKEKITAKTGLAYEKWPPVVFEAFKRCLAALKEYQQRKASANVRAPNPWVVGRSGYKNMKGRMEKANRTREIGYERWTKALKNLEKELDRYIRARQQAEARHRPEILFGERNNALSKGVRELRKKYKTQIEYLRKDYSGTSKGRKYVHYALKIGAERFGFTVDERGSVSFSRDFDTIGVRRDFTDLAGMLEAVDRFIQTVIKTQGAREK
jgi:hypothetical protein